MRGVPNCKTCGLPNFSEKALERMGDEVTDAEADASKQAFEEWKDRVRKSGGKVVECPECGAITSESGQ